MAKIVTLGEIMLRLSPEGNDRFIQSESLRIIPGGGEANVAVSLANYGHDAYFVSKLPKHEISSSAQWPGRACLRRSNPACRRAGR